MRRALHQFGNSARRIRVIVGQITPVTAKIDPLPPRGNLLQFAQECRLERGLLICGSGIGVTIAANKFHGIRASIAHDPASAEQGVVHDAMNVLSLGAKVIDAATATRVLAAFLAATPSDAERYVRRTKKVQQIEEEQG